MGENQSSEFLATGRGHASAAMALYEYALDEARRDGFPDPEQGAFNGTYSLSIFYLLGLGLELMLKAVVVAYDRDAGRARLKQIGHDLEKALDAAEQLGLGPHQGDLRALIGKLNEPYKRHWLRYERPDRFPLPRNFTEIRDILDRLDDELRALIYR